MLCTRLCIIEAFQYNLEKTIADKSTKNKQTKNSLTFKIEFAYSDVYPIWELHPEFSKLALNI